MKYILLLCFLISCRPSIILEDKYCVKVSFESEEGKPIKEVLAFSLHPSFEVLSGDNNFFTICNIRRPLKVKIVSVGYKSQYVTFPPGGNVKIVLVRESLLTDSGLISHYYTTPNTLN
jgi:hypothetical protein